MEILSVIDLFCSAHGSVPTEQVLRTSDIAQVEDSLDQRKKKKIIVETKPYEELFAFYLKPFRMQDKHIDEGALIGWNFFNFKSTYFVLLKT